MAEFSDPQDPNALTWADFERDLTVAGRSPRTIQSYREAAQQLATTPKAPTCSRRCRTPSRAT